MKKFYLLLAVVLLASCNTLKRAEKSINQGDYAAAFDLLASRYQNGISEKKYEKFLPAFQEAYLKMIDSEEAKIERLRMEDNPAYFGTIYNSLVNLNARQNDLKALLPLYYKGKALHFPTKNYHQAIVKAKSEYVEYLYTESQSAMNSNNKERIRNAYKNLKKVNRLSPGYGDVLNLIEEARFKGTDFVLLNIENQSNQMLPNRLERDLTRMNTYGLDDFWTEFHTENQSQIPYEYLIKMDFEQIMVSPERMNTVLHRFEKQVIDGWEYLYQDGHQVLDSLGEPIKVDRFVTVRAEVEESFQEKDAMVNGMVELIHLPTNRRLDSERLHSEFGFRNHFARMHGDERALDEEFVTLVGNRPIPFPTHEQMVYDCGEELKSQLKSMLRRKF